MDNEHMMEELIATYLLGEATAEEKQQVLDWMNASPENRERFYELKLIWNESRIPNPGADISIDNAWQNFQGRVAGPAVEKRVVPLFKWARAAAILVLLFAGSWIMYSYLSGDTGERIISSEITEYPKLVPDSSPIEEEITVAVDEDKADEEKADKIASETVKEKTGENDKQEQPQLAVNKNDKKPRQGNKLIADDCQTKKYVCNSTPCPIEICIVQKGHCEEGKPLPIFNCSVIQPDESGRLCYGGMDEKLYRDCMIAVQEIRIKRVSTGETIVLTQYSSPMTAQEVFNYISGQKKGDIVAGVFQNDCNNEPGTHSLTIENQYGSLLFK